MTDVAVSFITPYGITVPLHDPLNGIQLTGPVEDVFAPPFVIPSTAVAEQDGEWLDAPIRLDKRVVAVPVAVLDNTELAVRQRMRALVQRLNPRLGVGALVVSQAGVPNRQLNCYYSSGLEGLVNRREMGDAWVQAVINFIGLDPWWYDVDPQTAQWGTTGSSKFFPILPLMLGSSSAFGDQTITNNGDDSADPIWTIRGPGLSPAFTNLTTGLTLDLSGDGGLVMVAGDQLAVDTRRGVKNIVVVRAGGGVESAMHYMTGPSSLWPLQVDDNVVHAEMGGATNQSLIQLAFFQRRLTA